MENFDEGLPQEAQQTDRASVGVPPLRAEAYWQYLDAMDLTDVQKSCILHTLWTIMVGFVDLGFGVDPVQQILPVLMHATLEDEFCDAANSNMKGDSKK